MTTPNLFKFHSNYLIFAIKDHSGEINVPLSRGILTKDNIWAEIGEIVAGLKTGREGLGEITVFTSTGLAIQDAITADLAYRKALEAGVGGFIKLKS